MGRIIYESELCVRFKLRMIHDTTTSVTSNTTLCRSISYVFDTVFMYLCMYVRMHIPIASSVFLVSNETVAIIHIRFELSSNSLQSVRRYIFL